MQGSNYQKRNDRWDVIIGNSKLKPYNTNSNALKVSLDFGNTYISLMDNYDFSI